MNPLRLHLKREYFDAIQSGEKTHEYRRALRWELFVRGKVFSAIHLLLGYPKTGDESRIIRRPWRGYTVETITHPHFGPLPVRVLAFDVRP